MELNEFFTNVETIEIDVFGQKFKYKPVTAGDELDWAEDYIETKINVTGATTFLCDLDTQKMDAFVAPGTQTPAHCMPVSQSIDNVAQ